VLDDRRQGVRVYDWIMQGGEILDDTDTGARPGRLLRNA
jgi:hypothetical protein